MRTIDWSLKNTKAVFARTTDSGRSRVLPGVLLNVLIVLFVLFLEQLIEAIIMLVFLIPKMIGEMMDGKMDFAPSDLMTPEYTMLMLYLTLVAIGLGLLYCLVIERRSARSMGFTKHHCLRDYAAGFGIGIAMMAAIVGIACLGGGLRCTGTGINGKWGLLAAFVLGWMIQGLSEEVTFRGYFMVTLGANKSPWTAVSVSAIVFASAHLLNPGVSVFAVVNLVLYGVFAGLYFLRTDSVWGVGALHAMWNCAQGNLFGVQVSGVDVGVRVLTFEANPDRAWLNGGAFGLEGGAAVTIVLVLGIALLLWLPQRKALNGASSAPVSLPAENPVIATTTTPNPVQTTDSDGQTTPSDAD